MTNETQNEQAAAAVDITMLPPADRAVIVFNSTKTEQDLHAMVAEAKAITEVSDKAGRDAAHAVAMKLRKARTTIEKTGKTAREDATAFSSAVIALEKKLKAITADEEGRVLALRDAYDAKLEAEKEAARAAEAQRIAEILEKIEGIRRLPMNLVGETAEVILAERDALASFEPSADVFGEFVDQVMAARAYAIRALDDMLAHLQAKAEAEALLAAELAAAREMAEKQAEADRLKAEAERVQAERDAMAAELAAARAQLAAAQAPKEAPAVDDEPPAFEDAGSESEPPVVDEQAIEVMTERGAEAWGGVDAEAARYGDLQAVAEAPADVAEVLEQTATATFTPASVRFISLSTAEQFRALADKVEACGFEHFANELRAIGYSLREGDHDTKIAAADFDAILTADELLAAATENCIEATESALKEAA